MEPLRVALRTYTLSLSLSLLPAILPVLASPKARSYKRLRQILQREFGPMGFAFSMTLAIAGGRAVDQIWTILSHPKASDSNAERSAPRISAKQRTFVANALSSSIAVLLLTSRRRAKHIPTASIPLTIPAPSPRGSPTLDLTLMLFVRALDVRVQSFFQSFCIPKEQDDSTFGPKEAENKQILRRVSADLDAFLFWLACSRIMWCFFYQPERLPRSYVKWITSLADMDTRLLEALRGIREGYWRYGSRSSSHNTLLTNMAVDLKLDSSWGDPTLIPVRGVDANQAWAALGVKGRKGVGGIPCEIVHCGLGGQSCTANALLRGIRAFGQAILIYTPVHLLPPLLTNPMQLIADPLPTIFSIVRSASFLSSFISSIWFTVCLIRTLFVARLFPRISHNFLDGPQGCILAGCLVCGTSIVIERGKRRGEIALYVLPRAIRACLPDKWVKSGSWSMKTAERLVLVWSLASILTAAIHQQEVLRGLSRWIVTYIISGTGSGFWKRRKQRHPAVGEIIPTKTLGSGAHGR